jgi:transposase-like protein
MADPRLEPLVLSEAERRTPDGLSAGRPAQGLALRARIVLACAEGGFNIAVATRLGVNRGTVARWRARFLRDPLDGLSDEPRPGVPRTITDAQVEEVVVRTLEEGSRRRRALVETGAGQAGGHLAGQRAADLGCLRAAAVAHRGLQHLPRFAAD